LKLNDYLEKLTGVAKGLKNSPRFIKLVATFRNVLFPLPGCI
jgi:hypothetical protein